ncbi:hypothetical protein CapIbe_008204 [Capra ibex]
MGTGSSKGYPCKIGTHSKKAQHLKTRGQPSLRCCGRGKGGILFSIKHLDITLYGKRCDSVKDLERRNFRITETLIVHMGHSVNGADKVLSSPLSISWINSNLKNEIMVVSGSPTNKGKGDIKTIWKYVIC